MAADSKKMRVDELSDKSFLFKEITWNIPKEAIVRNIEAHGIESPSFSFAGATWSFHIFPNGRKAANSVGRIHIQMNRLRSGVPRHYIFCKFYFETNKGKEFQPLQHQLGFNAQCDCGYVVYMSKDKFLRSKTSLIFKGIFTLQCQIRTKKVDEIHKSCQTEPVTFAGCNCATRNPTSFNSLKMLQDFKELYFKQEDCDTIIIVKEQKFRAHKNILKARSSVFASKLRTDKKEKIMNIINIQDCDPSSFSDFLCFIYCGNIEILSTVNVFSLFATADKYDVQDLRSECLEFMKKIMSVDTFCETIALAFQHSDKELIELTSNFFVKNIEEIIVTSKWKSFLVQNPIQSNELVIKALAFKKK